MSLGEATEPAQGRRRAATAFVLVTVTLDVLAMGIIGPVWPMAGKPQPA